ncbi:tetratricopeptide repeat protein [Rhodocytophaga aerolata]|uniref:Tetratricopeptide repeat protein n=1 Tax=Rhodocytophaga aerolata TaxID=455078 RepID=A0ABT8RAK9_9BACT|nr:tetratricopeptide repeat protein [Rhodocytophaga aerolata]MDO1448283.1 tetratricopeptide repeat protein [Rhodocytophaga aerolata]
MKSKLMLCLALLLGLVNLSMAQAPNWGANASEAQEKYALFTDAVKMNDWKTALGPLTYLLKNAPELNSGLYVNASKVYEGLVDQTKDPKQLAAYQDSALIMYDLRMKYFKDEANVLNRKGLKAHPYLMGRADANAQVDKLLPLYQKIVELNKDETYNTNIMFYMDLLCKKKAAGGLTDEQVLEEYDKFAPIIERKLASNDAANVQRWTATKEYVDQLLQSCVTIDCNFVKTKLGPKLQQSPDDVDLAKKIFGLMATGKCTTDPLFLQAGEIMVKKEPSYGVYRVLATIQKQNNNFDKAADYYEEAAKLATSGSDKAQAYVEIGQIKQRAGAKEAARTYYRRAAENGLTSAYASIGDLYLGSYKECGGGDAVKSKLVYIAAYEMYEKGGDKAGMAKAKQYFPSAEEIFTLGMTDQIGKQMNTGCWINESVTLQKK